MTVPRGPCRLWRTTPPQGATSRCGVARPLPADGPRSKNAPEAAISVPEASGWSVLRPRRGTGGGSSGGSRPEGTPGGTGGTGSSSRAPLAQGARRVCQTELERLFRAARPPLEACGGCCLAAAGRLEPARRRGAGLARRSGRLAP